MGRHVPGILGKPIGTALIRRNVCGAEVLFGIQHRDFRQRIDVIGFTSVKQIANKIPRCSGNVERHGHHLLTNIPQTEEYAKLLILILLGRLISESKLHAGTYAGITMTL